MPNKTPWIRFIAEGAVIVASILLAFVIDASWQRSQTHEETREMLVAVRSELITNLEELERAAARYSAREEAASQLLTLTGPGADAERIAAAARPIGTLMVPPRAGIEDAAMATLISSGQLARLDDAELRQALSGWRETLSNVARIGQAARDGWAGRAWPVVLQHIPQLDLEHASGFAGNGDLRAKFLEAVPPSSQFESDYPGLLGNMQFESAVVQVLTLSMLSASLIEAGAIPTGQALLALIERNLTAS